MLIRHTSLSHAYRGHDALVRASPVDWTLARAVMLGQKTGRGPVIVSHGGLPKPAMQISRASVANFLLDSLDDPGLIGKSPSVSQA